jgi:hypothetical protein
MDNNFNLDNRDVLAEFGSKVTVAERFLISTTVDEIGGKKGVV